MKVSVIGLGALNMDRVYRVRRIAGEGEESYITDYLESPGGSAANTVVGLSRLGVRTGYVGKLSRDREGRLLLKDLAEEGVDDEGVVVAQMGRSGVVHCFVDEEGERAMYVDPGVNDDLSLEEVNLEYFRRAEFLHLSSFIGENPFEAQKALLRSLRGVKASLDPGMHYSAKGLKGLKGLIKKCQILFPNERELELLTGMGYVEGSRLLIREGVKIIAVKLGERGCYVTDGVEGHRIDAYPSRVVDTTGAGDAFCAGFLFGLIRGKDLHTCGKLGNYVASRVISEKGARSGLPHREDLPQALQP